MSDDVYKALIGGLVTGIPLIIAAIATAIVTVKKNNNSNIAVALGVADSNAAVAKSVEVVKGTIEVVHDKVNGMQEKLLQGAEAKGARDQKDISDAAAAELITTIRQLVERLDSLEKANAERIAVDHQATEVVEARAAGIAEQKASEDKS